MRLNEFSTGDGPKGPKDYGQPNSSRYIGNGKFVVGTTHNYILTATIDKWGLEWDEDDEIWFLDSPGAAHIADASEGEIELPPAREQRYQIHDLVTDYLNTHNSPDLQKVAAYYGHSTDGEMATEGVRVSGQQIPGTKNRAKSAYYPTNVPPKVKKLDKPLTDKELSRLTNQGVKESIEDSPVASAIINRIMKQRPDLLKYGADRVGDAIDEVVSFVGDVDEIGTSDVSNWVRQVEQYVKGNNRGMYEGKPNLKCVCKTQGQDQCPVHAPLDETSLNELAPGGANRGDGNYLKALASAWYNGTFNTGDLHKGIKSQEDVERILERGIHCGDGKIRKYSIGYNADFDGVEIQSHDHYEYADTDNAGRDIDSRTGQPWSPYDVVEFHDSDLDESINENMDHSKDGRAVEELKAALEHQRKELQSLDDDKVYDIINKTMTRIAKSHSISGQKLHDMWVDKYKEIPDTWIMNSKQGVAEAKADPTGSWVVYNGSKVTKFKTHAGAKAYAEKNGGIVASSEYYYDKIQKKGVSEAMTPSGEFLSKEERLKAGDKIFYKGKVVGIATGEMNGNKVIFKPNQNYGSNVIASLPIDQISLREDNAASSKFLNPMAVAQDPSLEKEPDADVIFFGQMPRDFTADTVWEALEAVLPREYPPGRNSMGHPTSNAEHVTTEITKHQGAVVTTKPLSVAQKLVKTFQTYGIKCKINAKPSVSEGRHDPLDPYERDQANSTAGFGRPEDHRDDERHDLDPVLIYALKINGKIRKKYGETVTFFTKERALSARNSILAKSPELEITLLQRTKD